VTDTVLRARLTKRSARSAVAGVPKGMTRDDAKDALERCATAILVRIYDAFLVKSRGGTDDAGDRWAPLTPSTVAARLRKAGIKPNKRSKRPVAKSENDSSPAVRRARAVIKGQSRPPRYDKRDAGLLILNETGALLDSLSPFSDSPHKVVRVDRGQVSIGTNRPGAMAHHHGVPGKLPQRRLWPSPDNWPAHWWRDILDEVVQGVIETVAHNVGSAK
jgi:hypothetical protein